MEYVWHLLDVEISIFLYHLFHFIWTWTVHWYVEGIHFIFSYYSLKKRKKKKRAGLFGYVT